MTKSMSRDYFSTDYFHPMISKIVLLIINHYPAGFVASFILKSLTLLIRRSYRSIWFHGNAVEQFYAAEKVINDIKKKVKQCRFIFTSGDPNTYTWLLSRFSNDEVLPAPFDFPFIINRFFGILKPKMIVIIASDGEIGNRIYLIAANKRIPLVGINITCSDEKRGRVLAEHFSMLKLYHLCVQDKISFDFFRNQGIPESKMSITGNLSYEVNSDNSEKSKYLRKELGIRNDSPIVAVYKVSKEEETLILGAFKGFKSTFPYSILLLEPQYRFNKRRIIEKCKSFNLSCKFKSERLDGETPEVILFDKPGESNNFFCIASSVLIGGSFLSTKHPTNYLTSVPLGKPIVFGPEININADLLERLVKTNLAIESSPSNISKILLDVHTNPERHEIKIDSSKLIIPDKKEQAEKTYFSIMRFIPTLPDEDRIRQGWRVKTFRERFGQSLFWKFLARYRTKGRIDDWEILKKRLGNPRTILCLGNGPSSEDPGIKAISYDSLFRVNWLWKRRGFLVNPDLVIVGDPRTMHKVRSSIFGFLNEDMETGMLLRHMITRGPRLIEYITVERISPLIRNKTLKARPTSGALMLVVAAGLQPERLVIAGIDLYLHPFGAYPGDTVSDNNYAQVHDVDTDLAVIKAAVDSYKGELIIFSDELRKKLKGNKD